MSKSTTSKNVKVDVADKTKSTVATKAAVENVEKAKVNNMGKETTENTAFAEPKTEPAKVETKTENKSGLPFTVKDGLVTVVSVKRAGKSVIGSSGDVIKFDDKGVATVKLEDALHFQKIPGFEFK